MFAWMLLLAACDPCGHGFVLRDPLGLLSAGEADDLVARHDAFVDASASDAACMRSARIVEDPADVGRVGRRLWLTPDGAASDLRWYQCGWLDKVHDHTAAAPELFGPDARHDFQTACTFDMVNADWRDQVRAACGTDELNDRHTYFADHAFPNLPPGRNDGPLPSEPALSLPLSGPGWDGEGLVRVRPVGDRLAVVRRRTIEGLERTQVGLLEAGTWELQVVYEELASASLPWTEWDIVAGEQGAVVQKRIDDDRTLWWLSPEGDFSRLPDMDIGSPYWGERAVGADTLWRWDGDWWSGPLVAVDLATGAETSFESPLPGEGANEVLISGLQVTDDGLYVERYDAWVEVDYDFIQIWGWRDELYRFDPADGSWHRTAEDLQILDAGTVDGRYVIGSVFSDAGRVVVAWDTHTTRLLVNDDLCLGDDYPSAVDSRGRLWRIRSEYDPDTWERLSSTLEVVPLILPHGR